MVQLRREQRLAETFVELADTMAEEFDLPGYLQLLADRCVELLDVTAVGLLLADPDGDLRTVCSPRGSTWLVDLLALEDEEGPCHDCYHSGSPIEAVGLGAAAERWPRYAPMGAAAGVGVTSAVPLRLRTDVIGALAFFLTDPEGLPPGDAAIGQALADAAAIGILQQRALERGRVLTGQLQTALTSRVIVEQAKGILSERWGTTVDDAFATLRRYARSHNERLADVARSVVARSADTDGLRPADGDPRP
ncbi:GAF and ANTAR domain-containing protein [Wenjunlia tyrosinilytica]|uniref:Transcriptional regulator n=1 Tax=Wenjunlia tyrosinilytica TaxID=1544741 RepID=A0A917ZQZ2_9ACTN|nr:GAF and ANTAR domain-containing protein [Wenjunlia tyrosinilytica]GGO89110.1 transcriptional regulator [Wenjunlia tyrosinilytica]